MKGHRMVVVGYPFEGGQLRLTVREMVGGWAFKEDEVSLSSQFPANRLPPDGGIGMKCLALYTYQPEESVENELAFPKNAEIREAERANDDRSWGVYAGEVKLFPRFPSNGCGKFDVGSDAVFNGGEAPDVREKLCLWWPVGAAISLGSALELTVARGQTPIGTEGGLLRSMARPAPVNSSDLATMMPLAVTA